MGELWQLSRQALLLDSRRIGSHLTRFGLSCVLYLSVIAANFDSSVSAAGLPLFHAQLLLTSFYVSAQAIFGFSQTITEEKEDGTLGLLRLAGISPLAILFGKSVGRLADAGLMIAVQLPFSLVAITLGGVSVAQMSAAYGALAAYLWLLSAVAVTCSVLSPTGGRAATWTAVFVSLYVLPPFIERLGFWFPAAVSRFYVEISLPLRINDVMQSGFGGDVWCVPMAVAIPGGLLALLVAWWQFDRVILSEPVVTKVASPATAMPRERAWSRPIVWRDYRYITGGGGWLMARVIVHFVIVAAMMSVCHWPAQGLAWGALIGGLFSLFDTTWAATNLFRSEIRDQTWSALAILPLNISTIVREKLYGFALGLFPSMVMPLAWIALAVVVAASERGFRSAEMTLELFAGTAAVSFSVAAYLHLLVLLSLYFGWQATPLSLTACLAAGWVYVTAFVPWNVSHWDRVVIFVVTIGVLVGIILGLQLLILRRLSALAATA